MDISDMPDKTDPDFKYKVVLGTLLRMKNPGQRHPGPLPQSRMLSVKTEETATWEGGVLRGKTIEQNRPPPKPYACELKCPICFDQFFPAYQSVTDAVASKVSHFCCWHFTMPAFASSFTSLTSILIEFWRFERGIARKLSMSMST
jgi:hypothetical protein